MLAYAPQDLHAAELRQQYIEQNQIVVALQCQVHGGAAVGGMFHPVALVLQLERHKAGDFLLVLYDQDPCHTCPPVCDYLSSLRFCLMSSAASAA